MPMTKEEALAIASEYDLEEEVEEAYRDYIEADIDESTAWLYALADWDLL